VYKRQEPKAEEMTRILNLIKTQLDTPADKTRYDKRLKNSRYAPLRSHSPHQKKSKSGRTILSADEIANRKKKAILAKKRAIKHKYEQSLTWFPKKARTAAVALFILFGIYLVHSHFYFYYGSLDRILFTAGIGLLFIAFAVGANEVYTRMVIQSLYKRFTYSYEKRIAWFFVLGYIFCLVGVFTFNKLRANYLLHNNYEYVLSTVKHKLSSYGTTVVYYEVSGKPYYRALDAHRYELPKIGKKLVMLRYAIPNPLICEPVDVNNLGDRPMGSAISLK